MKKEFKELLSMESGTMRINEITHLTRWTRDTITGEEIDKLYIWFDSPTGSRLFYNAEITARDTEGIAAQIAEHTREFSRRWADYETSRIINGRADYTIINKGGAL